MAVRSELQIQTETPDLLVIKCSALGVRFMGLISLLVGLVFAIGPVLSLPSGPAPRSDQWPVLIMIVAAGLVFIVLGWKTAATRDRTFRFDRRLAAFEITGGESRRLPLKEIVRAEIFVSPGMDVDTFGVNLVLAGSKEPIAMHASTSSTDRGACEAKVRRINEWLQSDP